MLDFDRFEVLTFDCYGTLIDWETGIWQALHPILAGHGINLPRDRVLELYGEFEPEVERGEYREYKTILRMVLEKFGSHFGFTPSTEELSSFPLSVRDWPSFLDSPRALQALHKKYKLSILSNVDDDLFAFSERKLQVKFDWIITAQQARSYKPALNNFRLAFEKIGLPQEKILHVAQSLFHDIAPANTLGLACVWVNRRHEQGGFGATPAAKARPDLDVPDLQSLAEMIGLLPSTPR